MRGRAAVAGSLLVAAVLTARPGDAQAVSQRGFAELDGVFFAQNALNDTTRAVADVVAREEVFLTLAPWLRLAAGADLRANSHDQVENDWRVDWSDRGGRRPRLSIRRASATITRGRFTVDVGKQFIRWGKADIVNPTDRFAPRDFLNVIKSEFLAVTGVRAVVRVSEQDVFEGVWLPQMTPSRVPLLNQRWTVLPPEASEVEIVDRGAVLPGGSQTGVRWSRVGARVEYSVSFFNGADTLPNIDARVRSGPAAEGGSVPRAFVPEVDVQRVYPPLRSYGADAALPTKWFTIKGEMAYFTSSSSSTDQYVLYVIQLERQTGEWLLVGGYAGEVVTDHRATLTFAPDRGITKSIVGRASYTIDPNRSLTFETVVRQNAAGAYVKAEYSQAYGGHWRATIGSALARGEPDDFLGQYRRNSHVSLALRYSF